MADFHFKSGAAVHTPDGSFFGIVERSSAEDVLVKNDDREVRVPQSMIDGDRSTSDFLVLSAIPKVHRNATGMTIPRHEEELSVRVTEGDQGKVRIRKSVEQIPVQQDVELGMDVVEVERMPSGEEYDEMPQPWQDGETLVIPVVEEVLVLTRRFRITENVRVTRRHETRTQRIETELRREVVSFDEEDVDGNPIEP